MSTMYTSRVTMNPQNRISLFNRPSEVFSRFNKFYLLDTEESVKFLDNVVLIHNSSTLISGELFLTNFKFVFVPYNTDFFYREFVIPEFFQIPYTFIVNIFKK
jgi:hypothetical protein